MKLLRGDSVNSCRCYVTRATTEELCFLRGPCRRVISGKSLELSSVVIRWAAENCVSGEFEDSPLLESVTRKRLINTLQAGEDLVFAAVTCKV
jgi:hypothetical protein